MQEKDRDIEQILKKIEEENRGVASEFKDSDIEFEIGKDKTSEEPVNQEPKKEINYSFSEEKAPAEEFSLPNIFDIAEKEDSATISDDIFKIKTTYIPRFTDVSDSYRRLGFVPESSVNDEKAEGLVLEREELDPTAEIDTGLSPDAKLVAVNSDAELINESTTMFKFEAYDEPQEEIAPEISEANATEPAVPEALVAEEAHSEEKTEETVSDKQEPVIIEEPLVKKVPVKFVPTDIAPVENITRVGDELQENAKTEYTTVSKRDSFKDRFLDTLLSQKVRFFVALAISLALLVFENLYIFGVDLISVFKFDAMPQGLAVIDLQCAVCLLVLSVPELVNAVKQCLNKRILSDMFIIPAFLVYFVYSVTIIVKMPTEYPLIGLLFAVYVLSAIASAYFRTKADFNAFNLISKEGDKKIVDNKYTRTLERENMALDGVVEEYKSRTARVFRTSFVADFFRRIKSVGESFKHLLLLVLVPLGVAFVTAVIVYFVDSGFLSAMTAFAIVFLLSLPSFSILVHKLPHYHASLEAEGENGAIIGENSHFDYAGVDVICFEDTEIFDAEDVNIQRIMLYGNNENLTKALRQMSALFMNVGGPLDIIFSSSLDRRCEAANGVSIKENGIIGEIDGNKVCAGSYEFMVSEGVLIPNDEDSGKRSFDATKIMYASENGVVYAKFYIRYRFSEDFTMLLPTLRDEGIIPLVYTRDPNVNNELLKTLTAGTNTVRILKKNTTPMRDFAPSKVSAGMVANGDKGSLVNLILLARRYVKFNARMKVSEQTSMIVGLVLGALLSLGKMTLLPSALLSLWQVAWFVALYLLSRSFFKLPRKNCGLPKKKKERRKNAK